MAFGKRLRRIGLGVATGGASEVARAARKKKKRPAAPPMGSRGNVTAGMAAGKRRPKKGMSKSMLGGIGSATAKMYR